MPADTKIHIKLNFKGLNYRLKCEFLHLVRPITMLKFEFDVYFTNNKDYLFLVFKLMIHGSVEILPGLDQIG